MTRLRLAQRLGLLSPLVRLARWADGHDAARPEPVRGESASAGVQHPAPLS